MRRTSALTLLAVLVCPLYAQEKLEPVRICVAMLENNSRQFVNATWERNQLVKALERTNKSKEVKKGKAPKVEVVALESSGEPDTTVREKNCEFVLRATLTEVMQAGRPSISAPPPGAIQVGTGMGDQRANPESNPEANPEDYNTATVNYDLMRAGNLKPWTSGMVSGQPVSQLMDQIANRVVVEIRKPHPSMPE